MSREIMFEVIASACTDVGRVRRTNEDSLILSNLSDGTSIGETGLMRFASGPHGSLFAVADGMGGAAAGEMASSVGVQTVCSGIQADVTRRREWRSEDLERILIDSVGEANRKIHSLSRRRQELEGMGTTLTIALEYRGYLILGQIGDSRAYLLRNGELRQLTRDQSLVAQKVYAGELSENEARHHPERNVLLQALGVQSTIEIAIGRLSLQEGDLLLLCSDGLHSQMSREEIHQILSRSPNLEEASANLVDLANVRGGPDNITAVLVQFLFPRGYRNDDDDDRSRGLFE